MLVFGSARSLPGPPRARAGPCWPPGPGRWLAAGFPANGPRRGERRATEHICRATPAYTPVSRACCALPGILSQGLSDGGVPAVGPRLIALYWEHRGCSLLSFQLPQTLTIPQSPWMSHRKASLSWGSPELPRLQIAPHGPPARAAAHLLQGLPPRSSRQLVHPAPRSSSFSPPPPPPTSAGFLLSRTSPLSLKTHGFQHLPLRTPSPPWPPRARLLRGTPASKLQSPRVVHLHVSPPTVPRPTPLGLHTLTTSAPTVTGVPARSKGGSRPASLILSAPVP